MGGGTKIEQPSPPPAPTAEDNMQDWIRNYPAMFALQQQYAPLEAQQQVELAQRFAQPLGEAFKAANDAMYPETSQLQENLAQQAQEGMASAPPQWMQDQYRSDLNANLGSNIGSGIGADYVSRGMLQQQQDWQNYYRNLGLSVAGRQPLTQAQSPTYSNYASTYTPGQVAGTNAANYGSYAGLYGNMYNTNASVANQSPAWANALGSIGGSMLGGWTGNQSGWWGSSSKRYKTNIKLWE